MSWQSDGQTGRDADGRTAAVLPARGQCAAVSRAPRPRGGRELTMLHAARRRVSPRDADENGSSSHGGTPRPGPPGGALHIATTQRRSVRSAPGAPRDTDASTVCTALRVAGASSTLGSNLFTSQPPTPRLQRRTARHPCSGGDLKEEGSETYRTGLAS